MSKDIDHVRRQIRNAMARPGMYVPSGTYEELTAFIAGMDWAVEGRALAGFQVWLLKRLRSKGTNIGWCGIISYAYDDLSPEKKSALGQTKIEFLKSLLTEWLDSAESIAG